MWALHNQYVLREVFNCYWTPITLHVLWAFKYQGPNLMLKPIITTQAQ